jgi:exodeoxyribonuclease V alpha subunit
MNASLTANFLMKFVKEKYGASDEEQEALHAVLERLNAGSICVPASVNLGNIVGGKDDLLPLVLHNGNLYLQKFWAYQRIVVRTVRLLADEGRLQIIAGGPGTGKTTSLAKKLNELFAQDANCKIALAAPTGKAAFRMKQSILGNSDTAPTVKAFVQKFPPQTLHRLLSGDSKDPLRVNAVVVDESSMVDIVMMARLLQRLGKGTTLYLLGDPDQLASVEAGSVFGDVFKAYETDTQITELKTVSHRFSETEGIGKMSKEVNAGNAESVREHLKQKSYGTQIEWHKSLSEEVLEKFKENLTFLLNSGVETKPQEALAALSKFQILATTRHGPAGVVALNKKMKQSAQGFVPLIVTQNDYGQGLFNGDIGVYRKEGEAEYAYFEGEQKGEVRRFPKILLPEHEDAFAITIHKSQGSEYDTVAVLFPTETNEEQEEFFTRELLYTGITRAKQKCLLVGSPEAIGAACVAQVRRASGITAILQNGELL